MILAIMAWLASAEKTSDCLDLFQALFWRHFVSHCREKTGILLTDLIMNVPAGVELSLCVNGQESEYPFGVSTYESQYSEIDESGNMYESG